jgi:mono/diheme cytochrome c family protein
MKYSLFLYIFNSYIFQKFIEKFGIGLNLFKHLKMVKKILIWTGICILSLLLILVVAVACRQNLTYEAPYPDITASSDSTVIAHGKELIFGVANCAACHTLHNTDSLLALGQDVPLSGGRAFNLPFGEMYVKNITSDPITGIGRLTDKEIARVLRYGVNANGTSALMPFQNFTDKDLTAIISYLRTQKPVSHVVPQHSFNVLGKVLKAFLLKPGGLNSKAPQYVQKDTTIAYGEYLAVNVADCRGCHTNGDMAGNLTGVPFSGGQEMEDTKTNMKFITPNLTPHPSSPMYSWSKQDFISRFHTGRVIAGSEMPWESYKRMSDNDLTAIYNFLRSLKPVPFGAEKK